MGVHADEAVRGVEFATFVRDGRLAAAASLGRLSTA
jgi:hypothetical protein